MFNVNVKHWLINITVFTCMTSPYVCADDSSGISIPERRHDQFLTEPGYYVVPTPYSIPGLGSGLIVVGALTNIRQSSADVYGFVATGDIKGYGFFLVQNFTSLRIS